MGVDDVVSVPGATEMTPQRWAVASDGDWVCWEVPALFSFLDLRMFGFDSG